MISLKKITKRYGAKTVFDNFSIDIEENKTTVILGESGSGKTTLLNIIAGLTKCTGEVSGVSGVSMVFQRDRLVPHLTARENVLLVNEKADALTLLKEAGLMGAENLYPSELSAGMARRVAICRAFSSSAPVVLMDEPLVNLDLSVKYSLMEQIKRFKTGGNKTVILVTHDIKEAVMLGDRIVVIKNGKIVSDLKTATEQQLTAIILNSSV